MLGMKKTGLVWNERYMWHDTGNAAGVMPAGFGVQPYQHAENPETKRRLKNLLDASGMTEKLVPVADRPATEEEVLRVHTLNYLSRLRELNKTGGDAGVFTSMGRGSLDIALLAAGGLIALVDAVLDGIVDNGYALVRPPGHHALADEGMGFCLLCNGAMAGRHALENRNLSRIAYVDWDVHHGNGTEQAFLEDPRALTISIHQDNCFPPDSGPMENTGRGEGEGFNLNLPLPPGSGVGAYVALFERVVIPALEAFKPDMIFVPCGFDAGAYDPLGRQMMTSEGYATLTSSLLVAADKLCAGRLVMCHEGGYDATTVPYFGLAVIETLCGVKSDMEDPFQPILAGLAGQELQAHQNEVIVRAERLLDELIKCW
jgi:acetoin utilization deacetylase AcuC-like enzyme